MPRVAFQEASESTDETRDCAARRRASLGNVVERISDGHGATVKQRTDKFNARHGSDAHKFKSEVQAYRVQIRHFERYTRCVLNPSKHTSFLNKWDFITMAALLYTMTLTPFEAAFLPAQVGPLAWRDPWFIVNRCLDLIFFVDMLLQFFIAYEQVAGMLGHLLLAPPPRPSSPPLLLAPPLHPSSSPLLLTPPHPLTARSACSGVTCGLKIRG